MVRIEKLKLNSKHITYCTVLIIYWKDKVQLQNGYIVTEWIEAYQRASLQTTCSMYEAYSKLKHAYFAC